jgi:hypothetical protein
VWAQIVTSLVEGAAVVTMRNYIEMVKQKEGEAGRAYGATESRALSKQERQAVFNRSLGNSPYKGGQRNHDEFIFSVRQYGSIGI